ncbi:uncharacterized protein BXZ73DRAFT_96587 [Epithele typhae]|uniref:uncharacterized protein n=1 Tax=Epithele typhae TaxID=378194 RepID=UPI0020088C12|nr:uncharacterized protein BXZ73DRAFT_96587 [Epithele typhae]KAH9944083.1 hypothetical protein BXZ73DRAFT_96587 [Epithele typhae]
MDAHPAADCYYYLYAPPASAHRPQHTPSLHMHHFFQTDGIAPAAATNSAGCIPVPDLQTDVPVYWSPAQEVVYPTDQPWPQTHYQYAPMYPPAPGHLPQQEDAPQYQPYYYTGIPYSTSAEPPDSSPESSASATLSPPTPEPSVPAAEKPVIAQENPLDVYLSAPQTTFQTPPELLADLTARDQSARLSDSEAPVGRAGQAKGASSKTLGKRKREGCEKEEKAENLNQRKAYFRDISTKVGFTITDPDTITSHDKKRCYLECMEEYIQFLTTGSSSLAKRRSLSVVSTNTKVSTIAPSGCVALSLLHSTANEWSFTETTFVNLRDMVLNSEAAEQEHQFQKNTLAMGPVYSRL